MKIATHKDNFYCLECGSKFKRQKTFWLPIKIKLHTRFSVGTHRFQVGYTFGGAKAFAAVIRLGWIIVIFGNKEYGGIGCKYDKEWSVMLHDDLYRQQEWKLVFEDALDKIFQKTPKNQNYD